MMGVAGVADMMILQRVRDEATRRRGDEAGQLPGDQYERQSRVDMVGAKSSEGNHRAAQITIPDQAIIRAAPPPFGRPPVAINVDPHGRQVFTTLASAENRWRQQPPPIHTCATVEYMPRGNAVAITRWLAPARQGSVRGEDCLASGCRNGLNGIHNMATMPISLASRARHDHACQSI